MSTINESTRDQLIKKTSDFVRESAADLTETAAVWNAQVVAAPTHGTRFTIGPTEYRFVSAGATAWDTAYWRILMGANVSTCASALSTAINFATNYDEKHGPATDMGATALTATGSCSDITITAATAGNYISINRGSVLAAKVAFTLSTENRTGHTLPEGYISYQTSAGNTVQVKDPAEYTRMCVSHPSKQN